MIVVLLGSAVAMFGGGSESNTYTQVSAEVEAYDPLIRTVAIVAFAAAFTAFAVAFAVAFAACAAFCEALTVACAVFCAAFAVC